MEQPGSTIGPHPGRRSFLASRGVTGTDAAAICAAVVIVVAFAPPLTFEAWTPRFAVVLAFVPIGLWQLGADVRDRDVAARWMAAVLAAAALSALVSGQLRSTVVGVVGRDLSLLSLTGAVGMWVVARRTSECGRRALTWATLGALTCNCAVAVLQVLLGLERGALALSGGRPFGFSVNPVYLGAVAAALALGGATVNPHGVRQRWVLRVMAMVGGSATVLSGSRVAAAATVVVLIGGFVARRIPLTRCVDVVAGLVVGAVLGQLYDAPDSVSRVGTIESGGRLQTWAYGLDAWRERPILGWGLGRFRASVQHRFSTEFVRDFALDETRQAWFDPHNIVILLLAGVGVVGLLLLAGWLVAVARCASGPMVWMIAPVVLTWLLQPVALVTLPLVMILLGASMPAAVRDRTNGGSRALAVTGVLGAVLAGSIVAGDAGVTFAADRSDGSSAAGWSRLLLWRDSVVADAVAQVYGFEFEGPSTEGLEWRRAAADADPERPLWWTRLGFAYVAVDDLDRAEDAFRRASELQPTNARVVELDARLAFDTRDRERFENAIARACDLGMEICGIDYDEQIRLGA